MRQWGLSKVRFTTFDCASFGQQLFFLLKCQVTRLLVRKGGSMVRKVWCAKCESVKVRCASGENKVRKEGAPGVEVVKVWRVQCASVVRKTVWCAKCGAQSVKVWCASGGKAVR